MTDTLVPCPAGQYRFLPGIDPYSCGVVAEVGHEIVHATLHTSVPYRQGFALIDRHLRERGRPRAALCAIELRIPGPFSFDGFAEFNEGYRALLVDWGLLIDGLNAIARTNVAPVVAPPAEPSLHAFSYTIPSQAPGARTFVVAGSGELLSGSMAAGAVVRRGDISPEALAEKADTVMAEQQRRLRGLGASWADVTCVDIYTAHPIHSFLASRVLTVVGPAAIHGVHWHLSRPPIADLDYEMDMRGVRQEIRLGR